MEPERRKSLSPRLAVHRTNRPYEQTATGPGLIHYLNCFVTTGYTGHEHAYLGVLGGKSDWGLNWAPSC